MLAVSDDDRPVDHHLANHTRRQTHAATPGAMK